MKAKNRKGLTKEVVEMKANGLSYAKIADTLGVSRQRVQQYFIPKRATMEEVADRARAICEECGQFEQFGHYHHKVYDFEILNEPGNIVYLCTLCHLKKNGEPHFCRNCGKLVLSGNKYCSPECRQLYYSVPYECSYCQKEFIMNARQKTRIQRSISGLIFCSKVCQGKYIGEHYGFQVHPENRRYSQNRNRTSKYEPLLPEIMMRLRNGQVLQHIIRTKGIPRGSHSLIGKLVQKYQRNILLL